MNNGKICISVCAKTADEMIEHIKRAEDLADVVEIRFDYLTFDELNIFFRLFAKIKPAIKRPILAAMHKSVETHSVGDYILANNFSVWEKILASNIADYFDPFQGGVTALLIECWNNFETTAIPIKSFFADAKKHKFIFSYHNFDNTPNDLEVRYETMKKTPADILKFAAQADEISDSIAVWKLLEKAQSESKQIIPIAMGEAGKWTRILGLAHGAFMTYAALETGKETASGQISAADLIETYRVRELDEQTEIYGILGDPVSHSLSPYIHNAAFKFHNRNAVFIPFEVKNLDEFIAKFVREETREIELNFKGFSVTAPHKQTIIKHLDSIDETAEIIGAVNTVTITGGKLHGYNTDAAGFIEPLKNAYVDLKTVEVAVLGSGGAARAAIYALQKAGANVTVFARNAGKSEDLAKEFQIEIEELNAQNSKLKTQKILVNATPLGTKGALENETPLAAEQMRDAHLAYDLVYNPFETRFLREAKQANVPTVGGMAMLIAQAMAQSEIWTGLDAPMREMSRAALAKLQR